MQVSQSNYDKLAKIVAFLQTQPAAELMANGDTSNCMLARFYRANVDGAVRSSFTFSKWVDAGNEEHDYFDADPPYDREYENDVSTFLCNIARQGTYGEAAARAAHLLRETVTIHS